MAQQTEVKQNNARKTVIRFVDMPDSQRKPFCEITAGDIPPGLDMDNVARSSCTRSQCVNLRKYNSCPYRAY